MTTNTQSALGAISGSVRPAWQRFLDTYEPLRPELYRYCRYLTRSPWDAEDLVQDTMARAFSTLAQMAGPPPNPRAWLFRVASNLWVDLARRARGTTPVIPETGVLAQSQGAREAAGTLIAQLAPQERAAVLLKDVFDLSLEEIAEVLTTSVGAVKAALSRGRGKLAEPEPVQTRVPTPKALDTFVQAFNAGDVDRLAALMLDTSVAQVIGCGTEYGPEQARRGILQGSMQSLGWSKEYNCGVGEEYLQGYVPGRPRFEVRTYRGEPIVLAWMRQDDAEVVRCVMRAELHDDKVARVASYFFIPDVIEEVCRELEVPFRTNGYRYWMKEA